MQLSRRSVLVGAASLGAHAALRPVAARAAGQALLTVATRVIDVGGKPATRYGVAQASGAFGLTLDEGDLFDVTVQNALTVPTSLHWHGLNPPWRQDGVPYISAPPILPGQSADYSFPAVPPGTRWMHSHFGLQEQDLLAAPLIIREREAIASGLQEVVVLFEDFSWTTPEEIFASLRNPPAAKPASSGGMAMPASGGTMAAGGSMAMPSGGTMAAGMAMPGAAASGAMHMDLNDVTYDAYLANDRTLADPQVIDVGKGATVRLRLINGAASTNFIVDLGAVSGTVVAVDGNPVEPMTVSRFPLATAQRVDILVTMPADGSAVPVLAKGEGRTLQAGVVLRPPGAAVAKLVDMAETAAPALDLMTEMKLRATQPLAARPVDVSIPVDLTGSMGSYVWGMDVNGQGGAPVAVAKDQRVELVFRNTTGMSHPMHVHGTSFQVSAIDGKAFSGAVRDTILVPPNTSVSVIFDAVNPGLWAFHCHNLFHMAAGMFTTLVYRGFE